MFTIWERFPGDVKHLGATYRHLYWGKGRWGVYVEGFCFEIGVNSVIDKHGQWVDVYFSYSHEPTR